MTNDSFQPEKWQALTEQKLSEAREAVNRLEHFIRKDLKETDKKIQMLRAKTQSQTDSESQQNSGT